MTADPAPVVALIDAFRQSKILFAAVALGIFDRLQDGSHKAQELARMLPTDPDALERLLNACVALGFLVKTEGEYRNTAVASQYLTRSSPHTLSGYIQYSNTALYSLWGNLEDAIREGSHRWTQTFGGRKALFTHFYRDDTSKRDFLAGMHGFGLLSSPAVVAAFDLSRFRKVVDLGGATGHLVMEAHKQFPHLETAILDLPAVLPISREYTDGTVELIAGDFFQDELPEADLFALGRIVHDWPEPAILALLTKICQRLPSGGGLLIAEKLLDEEKTGPLPALTQSLNMLVCTEGKERSFSEYLELLESAGFSEAQAKRTGAPLDAILAIKS